MSLMDMFRKKQVEAVAPAPIVETQEAAETQVSANPEMSSVGTATELGHVADVLAEANIEVTPQETQETTVVEGAAPIEQLNSDTTVSAVPEVAYSATEPSSEQAVVNMAEVEEPTDMTATTPELATDAPASYEAPVTEVVEPAQEPSTPPGFNIVDHIAEQPSAAYVDASTTAPQQ